LRNFQGIVSVTSGYGLPGDQYAGDGVRLPTRNGEKEFSSKVFIGDYDYVKTLGLRIVAGEIFQERCQQMKEKLF
jgi:putative ABC transport system permease protein